MPSGPLLLMRGITKRFGAVTALAGVDLGLEGGQVHALVGENGAGKSTLIKVMTGAYRRDAGTVLLGGTAGRFPLAARGPGPGRHRGLPGGEPPDAPDGGREHLPRPRANPLGTHRLEAPPRPGVEALARLGLDIDPTAVLGRLPIALRQMVAFARGVSLGARVLVLDEPTSSLTGREAAVLFDVIRRLKEGGAAVVYVSHRFEELYAVCDRVTVLRDGRHGATRPLAGLERLDLACLMLGKRREELRHGTTGLRRPAAPAGPRSCGPRA